MNKGRTRTCMYGVTQFKGRLLLFPTLRPFIHLAKAMITDKLRLGARIPLRVRYVVSLNSVSPHQQAIAAMHPARTITVIHL